MRFEGVKTCWLEGMSLVDACLAVPRQASIRVRKLLEDLAETLDLIHCLFDFSNLFHAWDVVNQSLALIFDITDASFERGDGLAEP